MTTKSLKKIIQHQAYHLVFMQLAGVLIIALLALLIAGQQSGFSVLAGGVAYGLLNLIFVALVFQYVGAQQAAQFMAAFFIGEMLKLVFSGILIVIIVKYLPVSLLSVLIGFIGAIVSFWIVCLIQFSK